MENSFIKFKKKIIQEVLLKALIISLFIALLIFSIPLLYYKIKEIEYHLIKLLLISSISFILIFIITFMILKPSNIKVAKRIDKQLNLNEKVQTMIEYQNKSSMMVELQRENTLEILNKTSIKKFTMKFSIVLFIALFISCAFCVTAIAFPTEEENTPIVIDPNYNADSWTIRALKDLIKEVEASDINELLKQKYVSRLNNLLEIIQNVEKESEMISSVNETINYIYNDLELVNTNKEIYEFLKTATITAISDLAVKIYNLNVNDIEEALDQIAATINGDSEAISLVNEQFYIILRTSTISNNEDGLFNKLYELSQNLNDCVGSDNIYTAVNNTVNEAKEGIVEQLQIQKDNSDMAVYIEETLIDIFELDEGEIGGNGNSNNNQSSNKDPIGSGNGDEDKKVNEGGLGTGEVLMGSDDTFFDPEEGIVKYGDVITSYYSYILGKINDGTLPEQYREYFEQYFELLFGTLEDE